MWFFILTKARVYGILHGLVVKRIAMPRDRVRTAPPYGPKGTMPHSTRHGPQRVTTRGHRWSDEAETTFLDHLAATANLTASARACGFGTQALYARRRMDPAFQQRWDAALSHGYAHIEALLVQRAIEALEGFAPDPDTPIIIRDMTVKDALILLGHHRRAIEGGPRSRRQWARPRSLDEVRDSILRKLEAFAPTGDHGAQGAGDGQVLAASDAARRD
jgi:hypothetical protein